MEHPPKVLEASVKILVEYGRYHVFIVIVRDEFGRRPWQIELRQNQLASQLEFQQWVDFVEKLRKRSATKIRPNVIMSENRCSMPQQSGYVGRLLLQRQLPRPPSHNPANYGLSPKTEFFNGIGGKRSFAQAALMK
jgi:hypothetical protein